LLKTVALRQWRLVAALVLLGCSLLGVGYGVSRPAAEEKAGEEPAAATIDEPGKPTPRRDRAGDPLPMGAAARLGTTRLRHTDLISALAFSPDGKTIFAAGRDAIRLWDAETGEERGNFGAAAKDPDTRMTVSPDGKFLALSSFDGVSWWDVPGRKLLHAVPHEGGALDFAADGATLRSGTKTWAVPTGKEQGAAPPPRMETQCVARSADGKRTAWLKAHEGTVYLCNGAKNEVSVRFHCDRASLAVFDPIGKTVAVGGCFIGVRGSVALFDADSGKEIRRFPGTWDAVQSLSISTDGRWLAASSGGVYVLVWEVATGELRHAFRVPPGSGNHPDIGLHSTAFSPDGKSLIAAGEGQTIHVWDLNTGKPKFPSEGHEGLVRAAFFSPNGKLLTTLGDDSRVHVWDVARSAETLVTPLPDFGLHNWTMFGSKYMPVGIFRAGAYAPDGRTIATADDNGWIRIWDAATGRELRHLDGCVVWPRALALSPDGQLLAAGGNGRTTSVWNVDTGRIVRTIESKLGENPLLFSRAEKGLIVGCRLWNVETGREIRRFGTDDELAIQAQSPDGRLLAAYDSQGALRLFDARSGAELPCTIDARRPLNKSGFDYVSPPSFSPDGRLLAYPEEGASSAIVLHEVSTGVERGRFTVEGRGVKIVGFLPDGRLLAAIGPDTSILLFDLTGRAGDGPPKTSALQPRELEARWQALASDGPKAHRAIWDLTSAPESVEFLDKLLVFEEPAAGESFQTLLAELDSPDFERREQAVRRLEQLGDRAEGGLRAALGAGPSLERRQRIESLLRDLAQSPQRLRSRRALEVLEHVGSPESRAVLRRLAEGSETLFVQREARAALVRLESDRR
jgi:WD40 repeat protein